MCCLLQKYIFNEYKSCIQTGSGPAATVRQAMSSPPKIDTNDVLQKILKKKPITGAGPGGEGTGGAFPRFLTQHQINCFYNTCQNSRNLSTIEISKQFYFMIIHIFYILVIYWF